MSNLNLTELTDQYGSEGQEVAIPARFVFLVDLNVTLDAVRRAANHPTGNYSTDLANSTLYATGPDKSAAHIQPQDLLVRALAVQRKIQKALEAAR